jgi:hypothetical protein
MALGGFLVGCYYSLQQWLHWSAMARFSHLGIILLLAAVLYFLVLWIVGLNPWRLLCQPNLEGSY